jgi:hypothetical protein
VGEESPLSYCLYEVPGARPNKGLLAWAAVVYVLCFCGGPRHHCCLLPRSRPGCILACSSALAMGGLFGSQLCLLSGVGVSGNSC